MMSFAKSMIQQSLNASAFGLRQMVRLMEVSPRDQVDGTDVAASCRHLLASLGGTMTSLMGQDEHKHGWLAYRALSTLDQCSNYIGDILPMDQGRVAWWESKNKLKVFCLFQYTDSILEIPMEGRFSLPDFVDRARELGPFLAPWACEGLGRCYTRQCWPQSNEGLMWTETTGPLQADCLAPLHVGMGQTLAERLLRRVSQSSGQQPLGDELQQFIDLCKANARAPYLKATIEPLGLIAYHLYPDLIQQIGQQLQTMEAELAALFWHGVGRGSYFEAQNLVPLPGSPWRAARTCCDLAPNEAARINALAGLIWALTLVNLEKPEVLAFFLDHNQERLQNGEAFRNGVTSAILLWQDCAPGDPVLKRFLQFSPTAGSAPTWQAMVRQPCLQALQSDYPILKQEHRLCDVFHYPL